MSESFHYSSSTDASVYEGDADLPAAQVITNTSTGRRQSVQSSQVAQAVQPALDISLQYSIPPEAATIYQPIYLPEGSEPFPSTEYSQLPPEQAPMAMIQGMRQEPYHAQSLPPSDMSYGYLPPPMPSGYQSSSYQSPLAPIQSYYPESQLPHRSMFDSFQFLRTSLSTSASASASASTSTPPSQSLGIEEREVTRQRKRLLQEGRREGKLRKRRARMSTSLPTSGTGLVASSPTGLVDASVSTAPPMTSTYVSDSLEKSSPRYPSFASSRSSESTYAGSSNFNPTMHNSQYYQPGPVNYPMSTLNPNILEPAIPPQNQLSYGGSRPNTSQTSLPPHLEPVVVDRREKPQCWEHGCNGREFSTFSNFLRHQREKSGSAAKSYCPNCNAEFTRTTARNGHMEHGKCKARRNSGGGS